jgi:hypothetical protein
VVVRLLLLLLLIVGSWAVVLGVVWAIWKLV